MISKNTCIVFAVMLASLATNLDAKPAEHQLNNDNESEINEQKTNEKNSPVGHHLSKRHEHSGRKRRGFARWDVPQADYAKFSAWSPAAYMLNRPYFIPIYGSAGQTPIFFPPQAFNRNVGLPPDNPFMAPQYLPPTESTTKPTTTTMKIGNRFSFYEDEESKPIWPDSFQQKQPQTTVRPKPAGNQPTRLPKPKSTTETPALVHKGDKSEVPQKSIDSNLKETNAAIENIFGNSENYKTTTAATTTTAGTIPSDCVWAVVSCCSVTSDKVADACFEQRGCPGPFWGTSPCDSQLAKAAIKVALEYYG